VEVSSTRRAPRWRWVIGPVSCTRSISPTDRCRRAGRRRPRRPPSDPARRAASPGTTAPPHRPRSGRTASACPATRRSTPPHRWCRPRRQRRLFRRRERRGSHRGRLLRLRPRRHAVVERVATNPPTDAVPDTGVQASPGGCRRRCPVRRRRIAGAARPTRCAPRMARNSAGGPSSRPTASSPRRPSVISTAPARTRWSSAVHPRPASPTAATTRTVATCGSSTTTAA
jgi:hypothetical protein